jgi:MFS family permease
VDVSGIPAVARDVLNQPVKSMIRPVDVEGLQTYVIERYGRITNRRNFLAATIAQCMLICGALIGSYFLFKNWRAGAGGLFLLVMLVAVAGVFVVVLLRTIHLYYRQCILIVGPESLSRIIRGPFKKAENHWAVHEIAGLHMDYTMDKRSFRLYSADLTNVILLLTMTNGTMHRVLTGKQMEMRWLATRLRHDLGVSNA